MVHRSKYADMYHTVEIGFRWTYVAGALDCIRDVLTDRRLEALATRPEPIASYNGDVINGPVSPF